MTVYTTSHADETATLGANLAARMRGGEVICLTGELGSGKTTFVTGFIRHFLPHARVLSPTFTLVRQYTVKHAAIRHIYHLDLYRLKQHADIAHLGIEEYMNSPDTVVLVEWPERLSDTHATHRIDMQFAVLADIRRSITVSPKNIL